MIRGIQDPSVKSMERFKLAQYLSEHVVMSNGSSSVAVDTFRLSLLERCVSELTDPPSTSLAISQIQQLHEKLDGKPSDDRESSDHHESSDHSKSSDIIGKIIGKGSDYYPHDDNTHKTKSHIPSPSDPTPPPPPPPPPPPIVDLTLAAASSSPTRKRRRPRTAVRDPSSTATATTSVQPVTFADDIPIIRKSVQKIQEMMEAMKPQCVICLEAMRSIRFACGHVVCCKSCTDKLVSRASTAGSSAAAAAASSNSSHKTSTSDVGCPICKKPCFPILPVFL